MVAARSAVAGLVLLAASGCVPASEAQKPVPDRASRRAHLAAAESILPVLSGAEDADVLRDADVVLLDPDFYEAADIAALREAGTLSLGYLNIGEAETYRSFYDDVDPAWVLGDNPFWEGHQYIDARNEGWRDLVVDRVAAAIVAKEFDGLFLDMADVAAPGVHPETREGIEQLLLRLRETFPTHLMVLNRGLFLLGAEAANPGIEPALDGLAVEGVFVRHDFSADASIVTPAKKRSALTAALLDFRARTGGAAFAIDYADTPALEAYARAEAAGEGVPIFVGTVDLGPADPNAP